MMSAASPCDLWPGILGGQQQPAIHVHAMPRADGLQAQAVGAIELYGDRRRGERDEHAIAHAFQLHGP